MLTRNMVGYGSRTFPFQWPNKANLAISFVVNYEEGAELSPVNQDLVSETYGGEFPLSKKPKGMRNVSMESLFEYGSRTGIWRLLRLFDGENIPITFFLTGFALQQNPELCTYLQTTTHEIAGHGWRWIDYAQMSARQEEEHIRLCIDTVTSLTGQKPLGWYTGRRSERTRSLLRKIGGFLYDSDSYADDLPYFEENHLIIPHTLDCNDFRFSTSPGFSTADDFFNHLQHSFDYLYQEKRLSMMTISLHPRISGHPGRCMAIKTFIDYLKRYPDIWITHRRNIAEYWLKQQPPGAQPSVTATNC